MNTVNAIHKAGWFASVGALTLFSGSAAAAPLGLQDVPLFLSSGAEPNVMLMIDSSGSMNNIVPESPYEAATTYLTGCSGTNLVAASTQVTLHVSSGSPRIRLGGGSTDYTLGTTGTTARCFDTATSYIADLNESGAGLPAQ